MESVQMLQEWRGGAQVYTQTLSFASGRSRALSMSPLIAKWSYLFPVASQALTS